MGKKKIQFSGLPEGGYVREISLKKGQFSESAGYPYSIPAIQNLKTLRLDPKVTYFVGENGSGKSTLIEAITIAAGFNPEGGSKDLKFSTKRTESQLHEIIQITPEIHREKDGYFMRAESLYNLATEIDASEEALPGLLKSYGGKSLHDQSHGESFIALAAHRFRGNGLYILDEPEAALSPSRQLAFLKVIDNLIRNKNSQFVIATHSPILMAYPGALIYHLDSEGIRTIEYEETEHYRLTRDFLNNREMFLGHLLED